MEWSKDSLYDKSKIFFEKAFSEDRENIFFGLFCSMGLELLERAAIAKVSPTLLADQDDLQRHILYALNNPAGSVEPKSIITAKVIALCEKLIPDFDKECINISSALAKRRNSEVHSGSMSFIEFNSDQWLGGFFKTTKILADFLEVSMYDLFDVHTALEAEEILKVDYDSVVKKVKEEINARRSIYESDCHNDKAGMESKIKENENRVLLASYQGYHDVSCPACGNKGTIYGHNFAKERKIFDDSGVEIIQHITATKFNCNVCGLKLNSNQELKIANLPLSYNKKLFYSPEEYYGFEGPEDLSTLEGYWESYSND